MDHISTITLCHTSTAAHATHTTHAARHLVAAASPHGIYMYHVLHHVFGHLSQDSLAKAVKPHGRRAYHRENLDHLHFHPALLLHHLAMACPVRFFGHPSLHCHLYLTSAHELQVIVATKHAHDVDVAVAAHGLGHLGPHAGEFLHAFGRAWAETVHAVIGKQVRHFTVVLEPSA